MSTQTMASFLAARLRRSSESIAEAMAKMPDDKRAWEPRVESHSARSALDQVKECAYVNEWCASAVRAGVPPEFDSVAFETRTSEPMSFEHADRWLKESSEALAGAVEAAPSGQMDATITHPFTGKPATWAEFVNTAIWNMAYHDGQINYIQLLYGDKS